MQNIVILAILFFFVIVSGVGFAQSTTIQNEPYNFSVDTLDFVTQERDIEAVVCIDRHYEGAGFPVVNVKIENKVTDISVTKQVHLSTDFSTDTDQDDLCTKVPFSFSEIGITQYNQTYMVVASINDGQLSLATETDMSDNYLSKAHTYNVSNSSHKPKLDRDTQIVLDDTTIILKICNNDFSAKLPEIIQPIISVTNTYTKETYFISPFSFSSFEKGSCKEAEVHRRQLGLDRNYTYTLLLEIDDDIFKTYFQRTGQIELTVESLISDRRILNDNFDLVLDRIFVQHDEIKVGVCNVGGKTSPDTDLYINFYAGALSGSSDIQGISPGYVVQKEIAVGSDQCRNIDVPLKDLPDEMFGEETTKTLTISVQQYSDKDEYDTTNNTNIIRLEGMQQDKEKQKKEIDDEDSNLLLNPSNQEVVDWMYENNLTIFQTVEEFKREDTVTRGQISKFFSQYARLRGLKEKKSENECLFQDISGYDYTLIPHIIKACTLGLMKGFESNYSPNNNLTHAEGLTVIIRSIAGILDETLTPRWTAYYDKGVIFKIIEESEFSADNDITRGQVGVRLYRAYHKFTE